MGRGAGTGPVPSQTHMLTLLIFLLTWLILGLLVAWCSHSKTINGKEDE